ncbi:uncharacterized protein PITG_07576 [Phytophthora infestans T30-4]|uniref:GPI-anchored protein n=1 Tax=Phytophthora infestans (strain T30-4) TaxID=403677 RepID=D0N8P4_PHYIT|nr:uncharacterized protein PITG_07576 [Phytophthora infestans T30-4]EEY53929.1 conserved hypothetical protein [Phytophthora infestans T30-4]|eukprot:XP_002904560.1 conserved hypothetical protein [Phytophthora infestans T30-4]
MRLYHVLLATAAALLASNNGFAIADEKCTIVTKAPKATPVGSSSYTSSGSSADTPATQDSTAASDVGASQETTVDVPVQQYSNPGSDVGASEASTSDADETEQTDSSSYTPSSVDASQNMDTVSSAETTGDADQSLTFTEVPKATTLTPTVASSASASGSSAGSPPTTSNNSTTPSTSTTPGENSKLCAKPRIEITEVTVDASVDANEDEAALKLVAIAAIPGGGSRVAYHSGENVIVQELDASDKLVSGSTAKVPVHDFADIYADKDGPAVPCYDMYMIRYDGTKESWATKLTSSSASLPPYSSGKTGPDVYMIWWYAHHGRIASDGKNWAAYFRSRRTRTRLTGGCSHSAYERITYDNRTDSYATICKTDSNNRIMPPKDWGTTIYPVDLGAANLGDIVPDSDASSKKYWATVSNGNGDNAKVHLIHFAMNAAASEDITLGGTDANERAPHLAQIGSGGMLAVWEGSSSGGDFMEGGDRTMYAQVLDASSGKAISDKVTVDKSVVGNRYQALKTYPDGSVAYLSKGKTDSSLQVVRFYGC